MSGNENQILADAASTTHGPGSASMAGAARRRSLQVGTAFLAVLWLCPPALAQTNDLMVYPAKGQSADQQKRDRGDCHLWAVDQTGFDPSKVTPPPSTITTTTEQGRAAGSGALARGAARGAAVGAVGGAIGGDAGKGAAIGAATGTLIGGMRHRDATRPQTISETNPAYSDYKARQDRYLKATKVCLAARGYTVE